MPRGPLHRAAAVIRAKEEPERERERMRAGSQKSQPFVAQCWKGRPPLLFFPLLSETLGRSLPKDLNARRHGDHWNPSGKTDGGRNRRRSLAQTSGPLEPGGEDSSVAAVGHPGLCLTCL